MYMRKRDILARTEGDSLGWIRSRGNEDTAAHLYSVDEEECVEQPVT